MEQVGGVTREIAEFVVGAVWDSLPEDVVDEAINHVLDSWGVMLAGSVERCSSIVRRVSVPQTGGSSVVGGGRSSPAAAALANGVAGHALDYDDTQLSTSAEAVYGLLTHPSVPTLAAVSAVGEDRGISGPDLITAFVLGVEVACRVADAINPRHYQDGFHSTGTAGTIGAAVGASSALGLPADQVVSAIGIAASMAAGLRENFGTMTKPLNSGRAAQNGVTAAQLAQGGFTASPVALEGGRGFFHAAGGGFRFQRITGVLGRPFFLVSPGISVKPYPSGSLSHPAQDLVLDLIREKDLRAEDIAEVVVGTNSNVPNALIHHRPTTGLQGKFSMEYCVATGVVRRRAGIKDFTDEAVLDPAIQEFLPKVSMVVDPDLEALGYQHVRTKLRVRTTAGQSFDREAEWARGYPQKPLTPDQLSAKFLDCAAVVLPEGQAKAAMKAAMNLPKATEVGEVMALLRHQP